MIHLTRNGGNAYDPSTQTGGALCVPDQPGLQRSLVSNTQTENTQNGMKKDPSILISPQTCIISPVRM